ncbi:MAG TPA: radical SAM protein [Ignavibacteria bacterium]|nr:radical SAM protein [Ignavibacteria bacterium]
MMLGDIQIQDIMSLAKSKIIPVSILIEVCYTCNERCNHCFLNSHKEKGLTLKQYKKLFAQLVDAGTMFVILTGGEPFTRPDFMDIVREARRKRISVSIFTNGTLLTQEIITELKDLFVNEVHISLYGANATTHDEVTRIRGSFSKSVQSIKWLVESGITTRIKSPLMSGTVSELDDIKKLSHTLGTEIQFTTVITAKDNGDKSTRQLQLSDEQLKLVLADEEVSPISNESIRFGDYSRCIPCDTVLNGGAIDPYGNVYPCNQMRISGGNILKIPFGDIWKDSLVFQDLRKIRLEDLHSCKRCEFFQFCTRCPGLASLEDGNLVGCSTSAKQLAKIRKELQVFPTQRHIFSKPN